MRRSRLVRDPFERPDDVGTKSTAIVRTSRGI